MRRVLFLSVCVVLGSALVADAYYVDDGFFRGTLVPLSPTSNEIDISLLPSAIPAEPTGLTVTGLDVACVTVESNATFRLGGTHNPDESGDWSDHLMTKAFQISPPASPANPAETYFNFDAKLDAVINAGAFPNVTSFSGSATTSTGLSSGSLLGSVIVDNGSWVALSGTLHYSDGTSAAFTSTVPEPGTLAMLIGGALALFGMGLARWRRR